MERRDVETVRRIVVVDRAVGAMFDLPYADRQQQVSDSLEGRGHDRARGALQVRLDEHDLRSAERSS